MVCGKCGTQNVENAKFCGHCGARIDGKKACLACGELNDESSLFCVHCGARMDGKKNCLYCGATYDGNFCTECGHGAEPTVEEEVATTSVRYAALPETRTAVASEKRWSTAKIFEIAAGALSMLAVLCALIFVFFIGVSPDVAGIVNKKQPQTIFYYFGDYQKEIAPTLKLTVADASEMGYTAWFLKQLQSSISTVGVFGLIVGILALASVVSFASVAITVYVRNLLGYTEKKADKWAIACVFNFFVFALAFFSLHTAGVEGLDSLSAAGDVPEEEVLEVLGLYGLLGKLGIALSGTTKAGIVLCAVFLGLFVVCKLAVLGKKLLNRKIIVGSVLACVGVAFTAVTVSMAKGVGFAVELVVGNSGVLDIAFSPLTANTSLTALFAGLGSGLKTGYTQLTQAVATMVTFNVLVQVMSLLTIVGAGLAMMENVRGVMGERNDAVVSWSVVALTSILTLIFSIVAYQQFEAACGVLLGEDTEDLFEIFSPNYAKQICAVVFSLLALIVGVVQSVLRRKERQP